MHYDIPTNNKCCYYDRCILTKILKTPTYT